jgi:hypothetical protein
MPEKQEIAASTNPLPFKPLSEERPPEIASGTTTPQTAMQPQGDVFVSRNICESCSG